MSPEEFEELWDKADEDTRAKFLCVLDRRYGLMALARSFEKFCKKKETKGDNDAP